MIIIVFEKNMEYDNHTGKWSDINSFIHLFTIIIFGSRKSEIFEYEDVQLIQLYVTIA